jgi:hypothetical protein
MARNKPNTDPNFSLLQVRLTPAARTKLESLISPEHRTLKSIIMEGIDLVHARRHGAPAETSKQA